MSMTTPATPSTRSISPSRRIWLRFRADKTGYWSLVIFSILFIVSLGAELVSNDKPLVASYQGKLMFPMLKDYSDKHFGGDSTRPPTISIPSSNSNSARTATG